MMNAKRIILILSAIFYIVMLILSISVRKIHIASLPRVKVARLDFISFKNESEADASLADINIADIAEADKGEADARETIATADNGAIENDSNYVPSSYEFCLAIPKKICDNKKVFILSTRVINGEERTVAREVSNLELGRANDSFYEVINGISLLDEVIIEGQDKLQDGCEVYVEE